LPVRGAGERVTENIGAPLHTVMERLLDDVSFEAPDLVEKTVMIDEAYVEWMLAESSRTRDLSRTSCRIFWPVTRT
jgi:ATP-dependent HslUV protease ATP-binding subunit HslU